MKISCFILSIVTWANRNFIIPDSNTKTSVFYCISMMIKRSQILSATKTANGPKIVCWWVVEHNQLLNDFLTDTYDLAEKPDTKVFQE